MPVTWDPSAAPRIAERKIGKQKTRHADLLDDILRATHDDGGNAVCLQHPRDHAYGLVADRTIGNQYRCIDAVFLATCKDFRGVGLERRTMAAIGRGAMKACGNSADPA